MKIFVCHQFLPPLLLLSCCQCLAAVHWEVNAGNQQSIYNVNPRFNGMRSDLKVNKQRSKDHFLTTNSSRADFPCPAAAAIAPCTCREDSYFRVYFDCTFVESIDQLEEVFQQDFPVKELYQFTMSNNSVISWFPSFMNGITFESVYLDPGPFILTAITEHFLFDLKDTLKKFVIRRSKLTTDSFPFFMLPSMNQLEDLRIDYSDISWIPQIRAPKLFHFGLEYSPYELLLNGTFPIGTGAMTILIGENQIHSVEVGSIFFADQISADSKGPIYIHIGFNKLQSLRAGTFPLRNGPMTVLLYYNQISSIEPSTFILPSSTDLLTLYLRLDSNELKTVDEAVFKSLMPFVTNLYLSGNPLICGCDLAWLILNEEFLATVDTTAKCADGTNLHDLDPQQYINLC